MIAPSPLRWWAAGWWVAAHLAVDTLLALVWWALLSLLLLGVALVPVLGLGVPVLLLVHRLLRGAAAVERARLRLLGTDVAGPGPQPPGPWWRRALLDIRPWRTAGHLAVVGTVGLLGGTVALVLAGSGLAALLAPAVSDRDVLALPFGVPGTVDAAPAALVAAGLAALLLTPLAARALATAERATGPALLGPRQRSVAELEARVDTLTTTRERALDSVEDERRRIERDLHDGPQQRLVALALQVGMAKRALDRDGPDAARAHLDAASGAVTAAIADMRLVARGVHPPVLTDRGLDAAVSALAAATPVPVEVDASPDLADRPSPTSEAIAYFCVSEALTNVAKHARATRARVQLWREESPGGALLRVRVGDDGVGGARPGHGGVADGGSGLRGLSDRVAAVDGHLDVVSPPGGPTTLDVTVPWTAGGAR